MSGKRYQVREVARLAEMYVTDERFAATFEKYGEGLAAYAVEAIRCNARGR